MLSSSQKAEGTGERAEGRRIKDEGGIEESEAPIIHHPSPVSSLQSPVSSLLLAAALAYARRGWRVAPLHAPVWPKVGAAPVCSCGKPGCEALGKHPHWHREWAPHGLKDATTDEATIRRWWTMWPLANIGVVTGAASGLVVLDVDPGHGGEESLAALTARLGPLPATVVSLTGGGGRHWLFAHPGGVVPNSAGQLGPGLDVRGDGGYIVAPPSLHKSGQRYVWAAASEPATTPLAVWPFQRGQPGRRAEEPYVTEGQRNNYLFRLAAQGSRQGWQPTSLAAALVAENQAVCQPPLPDAEVRSIAQSSQRYRAKAAEGPVPPAHSYVVVTNRTENIPSHDLAAVFETTPTAVEYVVRPWLGAGFVTELAGKPKASGKTTLALAMCQAILTGQPFLDEPTRQCGVYYLTEQSRASFLQSAERARLRGLAGFRVVFWDEVSRWPWPELVAAASAEAKAMGAGVLVVDTLPQFVGLQGDTENNAGAALEAYAPLKQAAGLGLAVLVIRHERKGGGEVGEAARGSSAYGGSADTVLSLRRGTGASKETARFLYSLSRLSDIPRQFELELTPDGYRPVTARRTPTPPATSPAPLLNIIPVGRAQAVLIQDILKQTGGVRITLQKRLQTFLEQGQVEREQLEEPGRPYVYWRPG